MKKYVEEYEMRWKGREREKTKNITGEKPKVFNLNFVYKDSCWFFLWT